MRNRMEKVFQYFLLVLSVLTIFPVSAAWAGDHPAPVVFQSTGAATLDIPIAVPAGRGAAVPSLNLSYNSYAKNGILGVGWSMNSGSIERSIKEGVCYDCNDYVANGADLVAIDTANGDYGEKIEGGFSKYHYNSTTKGWEVTTREGVRYYYGTSADSRVEDGDNIFRWGLDKVLDTNGNIMEVAYTKNPLPAQSSNYTKIQIFPLEIKYTKTETSYFHKIKFYYEVKQDQNYSYHSNLKFINTHRLRTIEILAGESRVGAYNLTYKLSSSSFRSLLESVQQFGSDVDLDTKGYVITGGANPTSRMPEYTIDWEYAPNGNYATETTSVTLSANNKKFSGDFDGDGKADMLLYNKDTGTATYVKYKLDGSQVVATIANQASVYDEKFGFWQGDFDGDGKTDFMRLESDPDDLELDTEFSFSLSNGDGTFEPYTSPVMIYENPGFRALKVKEWLSNRQVKTFSGGFDGYGNTDVLFYNGTDFCLISPVKGYDWLNEKEYMHISWGKASFAADTWDIEKCWPGDYDGNGVTDLMSFKNNVFTSFFFEIKNSSQNPQSYIPYLFLESKTFTAYFTWDEDKPWLTGDFNGDGKTDLMTIVKEVYGGTTYTYAETLLFEGDGTASLASEQFWPEMTWPAKLDTNKMWAGDYNGDGKTDLLSYIDNDLVTLSTYYTTNQQLNYKATGQAKNIGNWDNDNIWQEDLNGDGKDDVVTFKNDALTAVISQGKVSDLVTSTSVDDRITSSFTYTPSSEYTNHKLPYVLQTVSSYTVYDGFKDSEGEQTNGLTTTYTYSGGLQDLLKRTFMGFEYVTEQTSKTKVVNKFLQTSEYVTGLRSDVDVWSVQGNTHLSHKHMEWETKDVVGGVFVKLASKTNNIYDNGATVSTVTDYTYYNDHGGLHTATTTGPGVDGDLTVVNEKKYHNYGDGTDPWVWRMTQESVKTEAGTVLRQVDYDYEAVTGNLAWTENWLVDGTNPRTDMTYDSYGNIDTVCANGSGLECLGGQKTDTDYDTLTNLYPVKVTLPETTNPVTLEKTSHVVEYLEYDYRFGQASRVKDENLNITESFFDEFGRVERVDYPDGGQVVTIYYDFEFPNRVVSMVNESDTKENAWVEGFGGEDGYEGCLGRGVDTYVYTDNLGRKLQTVSFGVDRTPQITNFLYDALGRNYRVEGPFIGTGTGYPQLAPAECAYTETTDFDERGRPLVVEQPAEEESELAALTKYTYLGLETTVEDPDGSKKTSKKDFMGRLTEVTEYGDLDEANVTHYTYNIVGDLKEIKNALYSEHQQKTILTYDTLGRKKTLNDPDMGLWTYTYYTNGKLETQTDAENRVIRFHYDGLNRIIKKTYEATTDNQVTYIYDKGPDPENPVPNCRGRLYSVSNVVGAQGTETLHEGYDAMGRVKKQTRTIDGTPYTTLYHYGISGKLTGMVYPGPDSFSIGYKYYDGTGLLEKVNGTSHLKEYAILTDYNEAGQIGQIQFGNDSSLEYEYDPLTKRMVGYVNESLVINPDGDIIQRTPYQKRQYTYTLAGDIESITDNMTSTTLSYTYDSMHRLVSEKSSADRSPETTPSAFFIENIYDEKPVHSVNTVRYKGVEYDNAHDNNGNITTKRDLKDLSVRGINYNGDNMPVSIERNGIEIATFDYDGSGTRVKKTEGGVSTVYVGAHYEVQNGKPVRYIFAGNLRVARVADDGEGGYQVFYYHKDHLGSTIVMDDEDQTTDGPASSYLPFGLDRGSASPDTRNYKFTDQEYDRGTGLYNYDARLYDPVIGMFLTGDTIVPNYTNPQTLNRYAYCLNNPLIYVDPTGHWSLKRHKDRFFDWANKKIERFARKSGLGEKYKKHFVQGGPNRVSVGVTTDGQGISFAGAGGNGGGGSSEQPELVWINPYDNSFGYSYLPDFVQTGILSPSDVFGDNFFNYGVPWYESGYPLTAELRIYNRPAFGAIGEFLGLNHAFVHSTETGRTLGTGGRPGDNPEKLDNLPYNVIGNPNGLSEDLLMDQFESWKNKGHYFIGNDCHSHISDWSDAHLLNNPGAPGGRFGGINYLDGTNPFYDRFNLVPYLAPN